MTWHDDWQNDRHRVDRMNYFRIQEAVNFFRGGLLIRHPEDIEIGSANGIQALVGGQMHEREEVCVGNMLRELSNAHEGSFDGKGVCSVGQSSAHTAAVFLVKPHLYLSSTDIIIIYYPYSRNLSFPPLPSSRGLRPVVIRRPTFTIVLQL